MPIPLIGLTTYNQKNIYGFPIAALMHKYSEAVMEAGGLPVLIPAGIGVDGIKELVARLDGLLITGGGDIDPDLYHGELHPCLDGVDPRRDAVEMELIRTAVVVGKPILGICRGFQAINVALGGTLYTHIPDQYPNAIKHNYDSETERELLAHMVRIEGATRLMDIIGDTEFPVNSLHHQGVKDLAEGVSPAGYAPDGLLEALEIPAHPFGLAVQWHPEWFTHLPPAQRLFKALVEAAGR